MKNLVGQKIKLLRKQNKLTQAELCGSFINRVILSKIENSKMLPSLEQLQYISKKLNTPLSYFLNEFESYYFGDENILESDTCFLYDWYLAEKYTDIVQFSKLNENKIKFTENLNTLYYIGMSYYNINLYDKSKKYLSIYINKYINSTDDFKKNNISYFAESQNVLFKISYKRNNLKKAEEYIKSAKKYIFIYNYINHRISFCIYNNLAILHIQKCNFNEAINLLENFLSITKHFQYLDILPDIYLSLNIAYYNLSKYEKAITYIKKAIYLFLHNDNKYEAGLSYLNYINALRYNKNFEESLNIINICKCNYTTYYNLQQRFLVQEMIIHFNMSNFEKVIDISKKIDLKELKKMSIFNYYYILCYIYCMNYDKKNTLLYLSKYEKHFVKEQYFYDLQIIYEKIYILTNNHTFFKKHMSFKNLKFRKNILITN